MSYSPCSQEWLGRSAQAARLLSLAVHERWLRARNSFDEQTDQSAANHSGAYLCLLLCRVILVLHQFRSLHNLVAVVVEPVDSWVS